jgi:hypothetical protein
MCLIYQYVLSLSGPKFVKEQQSLETSKSQKNQQQII